MKRDADEIKGIPAFPTVAAWPGWRRVVFRSTAAAAGFPQDATDMLLAAESWEGLPEKIIVKPEWMRLDAMLGKELKRILAKEVNLLREVCTAEDRALRTTNRQLPGLAIYIMIIRRFRNDQRLAKAQAMEELQECKYTTSLYDYITKWDRAMEGLSAAGDLTPSDEVIFYTLFKKNFLVAKEVSEHIAAFKRASP